MVEAQQIVHLSWLFSQFFREMYASCTSYCWLFLNWKLKDYHYQAFIALWRMMKLLLDQESSNPCLMSLCPALFACLWSSTSESNIWFYLSVFSPAHNLFIWPVLKQSHMQKLQNTGHWEVNLSLELVFCSILFKINNLDHPVCDPNLVKTIKLLSKYANSIICINVKSQRFFLCVCSHSQHLQRDFWVSYGYLGQIIEKASEIVWG